MFSTALYAVPSGTAVPFGVLPPGPYYALVSGGTSASNGIYLTDKGGTAPAGLWIPGGAPVPLTGFAGAAGPVALYAIAASGTVAASLTVSTPR